MRRKIDRLQEQLREGKISRRDFMRYAALLGLSVGAAQALASCAPGAQPAPEATSAAGMPTREWTPAVIGHVPGMDTDFSTPVGPTPVVTVESYAASGTPQATATPVMWERAQWSCPSCTERFDDQDALAAHVLEKHARKIPGVRRVEKPTYARFLTPDIARIDQRNTVFSRTMWDKAYQFELAGIVARVSREPPSQALEQMAMRQGAIYVDDAVGSLHAKYSGFSGHVRGVGGLYDWDEPVSPSQYPVNDPVAMSDRVKQVARFYGADLVGICEINPLWVYSDYFDRETGAYGKLSIPYRYAIVMGIEMSWPEIATSPAWGASAATALAYSRMAELCATMAKYVRMLGYPAVPSGNDSIQSIPLAIDAGLGELGRLGLLLTPEFGPRQRLCKVLTNLPLVPDRPVDFGIQKFCESCFVCAKNCPAKAIRFEQRTTQPTSISNRPGILRWPVNVSECYKFWRTNGKDCSNCVRACPWSAPQRNWI